MRTAQKSQNQYGFALLELLIVLLIIGVLIVVILNYINVEEYTKQARDARRLNDILAVQTAILNALTTEGITLVNTANCVTCNSFAGNNSINGAGWVKFTNIKGSGLNDIIQNLPTDPVNNNTYNFSYYSNGIEFELNAVLESEKYQINAQQDGGNNLSVYERGLDLEIN